MTNRMPDGLIKPAMTALALVMAASVLAACGGGGGSSPPTVSPPPPPPPPASSVTISGAITFDLVPLNASTNGLNYNAITQQPARGIMVEVVDGAGTVLDSDTTDAAGAYSVTVNPNTDVRIRARSRMVQTGAASWDITVRDNTSNDAIYLLNGSLTSSGSVATQTRNLNAGSGWGGASYTGTRAAAPFALLNWTYEAVQDFAAVDSSITFPALQIFWSVNNRPVSPRDIPAGDINQSSYTRINNVPTILILGDADNDTDEYDDHVVVHEFGHYFEDQLSRSDSVGGRHSIGNRLDPRVAFGEGWGNALSGMILDNPVYRDSSGPAQSTGFGFSVESNNYVNEGWFNEGSVQSILYDIFDSTNEAGDGLAVGLGPIYDTFTDPAYIGTPVFTTIFSYTDLLRNDPAITSGALTALLNAQMIFGTGPTGVGETNDGNLVPDTPLTNFSVLPVYKSVTVGGPAVQVCSVDDAGTQNRLGVREFLTLSIASSGSRTFTMTRIEGDPGRDPDFIVWQADTAVGAGFSPPAESETDTRNLPAGQYVIEAYDAQNVEAGGTPGDACYDFTVQ